MLHLSLSLLVVRNPVTEWIAINSSAIDWLIFEWEPVMDSRLVFCTMSIVRNELQDHKGMTAFNSDCH